MSRARKQARFDDDTEEDFYPNDTAGSDYVQSVAEGSGQKFHRKKKVNSLHSTVTSDASEANARPKKKNRASKRQLDVIEESDDEEQSQYTQQEERKRPKGKVLKKGQIAPREECDRDDDEIEKRTFAEPYF